MISQWLKVMLDEIARKKAQAEQERAEEQARADEAQRGTGPDAAPPEAERGRR